MIVKLLTEQRLEFLSLKGGCPGSSESTLFKIPHCWKSRVAAHFIVFSQMYHTGKKSLQSHGIIVASLLYHHCLRHRTFHPCLIVQRIHGHPHHLLAKEYCTRFLPICVV